MDNRDPLHYGLSGKHCVGHIVKNNVDYQIKGQETNHNYPRRPCAKHITRIKWPNHPNAVELNLQKHRWITVGRFLKINTNMVFEVDTATNQENKSTR